MTHIQLALSLARDFTMLHYSDTRDEPGATEEQVASGMLFTWRRFQAFAQPLICLGLDICGTKRWIRTLLRTPQAEARAFTQGERFWADAQPERLACLWTIKEALVKALGCGFTGLAYQDVALEFASGQVMAQLPATIFTDIPGALPISDLRWQLILFRTRSLSGALVCGWRYTGKDSQASVVPCHTALTHRIVLEFQPITASQAETRRGLRLAERQAARFAALQAIDRLQPSCRLRYLDIHQAHSGRPFFRVAEDGQSPGQCWCLSLSHCSDWAAAAVGGFSEE